MTHDTWQMTPVWLSGLLPHLVYRQHSSELGIVLEVQVEEVREGRDLWRQLPRQSVVLKVQLSQCLELRNPRRDGAGDVTAGEKEGLQHRQAARESWGGRQWWQ